MVKSSVVPYGPPFVKERLVSYCLNELERVINKLIVKEGTVSGRIMLKVS